MSSDSSRTGNRSASESKRSGDQQSRGGSAGTRTVGKYLIKKKLGQGGMGAVYLATDPNLNRDVALKVLARDKALNPTLVKRFQQEAQATASLKHDNIVSVYDAGQDGGHLFLALEYLEGTDVHKLIAKRKSLPVKRTIEIVRQVASALQHAYEQGIVHRDIKPSNLLISRDGTVKLTDMGLARFIDEAIETDITRAGTTVGTVDYMAPEQASSSRLADIRSDLYSLGCTWYHMLTGVPPFAEGSLTNKLFAHAGAKRPDPRALNDRVPGHIVRLLHRLMAADPNERFQTPDDLIAAIDNPTDDDVSLPESDASSMTLSEAALDAMNEPLDEWEDVPSGSASVPLRTTRLPQIPRKKASSSGFALPPLPVLIGGGVGLVLLIGLMAMMLSGGDDPSTDEEQPAETIAKTDSDDSDRNPSPRPIRPRVVGDNTPPRPDTNDGTGWIRNTPTERKSITIGSEAVRPFIPPWVQEASDAATPPNVRTVGRREGGPVGDVETLAEALRNIPAEGITLRLQGAGPFLLPVRQIRASGPIVIEGDPQTTTVIGIRPQQLDQLPQSLFDVTAPTLMLDRVHLFVDAATLPDQGTHRLVDLHGERLMVKASSITQLGERSGSLVGLHLEPKQGENGQAWITDSLLRGANLQPVAVHAARADVLLHRTGLATRSAPAIAIDVNGPTSPDSMSFVTVLSSRVAAYQKFLKLSDSYGEAESSRWRVHVEDSTVGVPTTQTDPVLISLPEWPGAENAQFKPAHLDLKLNANRFLGWRTLLSAKNGQHTVRSPLTWDRMWSTPVSSSQFRSTELWPSLPGDASLAEIAPQTLFETDAPTIPDAMQQRRMLGWLGQPLRSRSRFGWVATKQVEVNLDDEDLTRVINSDPVDGVEYIATGTGTVYLSPIHVHRRRVRIVFRQGEGDPLRIRPKFVDPDRAPGNGIALFLVERGAIELIGMHLEMRDSDRNRYPQWVLACSGGDFRIDHCHIASPTRPTELYRGLIRWTDPEVVSFPETTNQGWISHSFLKTETIAIDADLRSRSLFIEESAIASAGHILDVQLQSGRQIVAGNVVLSHSTMIFGEKAFGIDVSFVNRPDTPALTFYSRWSVFSKWEAEAEGTAKLFEIQARTQADRDIGWWGRGNAFGGDLADVSADGWKQRWGAEHIAEPQVGADVVRFADAPAEFRELQPNQIGIASGAAADRVTPTGRAAGADPERLTLTPPPPIETGGVAPSDTPQGRSPTDADGSSSEKPKKKQGPKKQGPINVFGPRKQ